MKICIRFFLSNIFEKIFRTDTRNKNVYKLVYLQKNLHGTMC